MMAKIEWYQEILEQEPSSRTFLPLAKLLIEAGQKEEAAATLRRGLERHPDFLEAKLELISLLHEQAAAQPGCAEECACEIGKLISQLKLYPAFWDAWAEAEGETDAALAIRFLRQEIDSPGLAFRDILRRALGDAPQSPARVAAPVPPPSAGGSSESEKGSSVDEAGNVPPRPFAVTLPADISGEISSVPPTAEDEGRVTLRTRSMAEVLAEQGDISGALEIYQELEAAAPTPEEAAVLRERVMALAAQINERPDAGSREKSEREAPVPDTADKGANASQDSGGDSGASPVTMLNLLETLADRLEARART